MFGVSIVVVVVALLLTGTKDGIGGTYEITKQYFTNGIDVQGGATIGSTSATSSINFGKACWTVGTVTGGTTYVSFNSTGSLATSSTSCN